MGWTQTDAHNLRRALAGLNPRATAGRPTAQATYECLVALADKAGKAIHGQPGALRDDQKAGLRQLVDDLYRVEPQDGPDVRCVSWDYREPPEIAELIDAITSVSGGTVHAREVDDGSQEYVLAVSRQPLDDAAALAAWEANR